jgi:protein-disulfide isomerase
MRRLREMLLNTALVVVTISAVVMVSLRVYQQFFAKGTSELKSHKIRDWRDYSAVGNRIGPPAAAVTVVEFSDFQCPVCRLAWADLQEIRTQYPDRVALVFRHFPLAMHQFAEDAAEASECAASQGVFEAYYNVLFSSQNLIGRRSWTEYARTAGVSDTQAFEACVGAHAGSARLERDRAAGKQLGVVGTPTLLINDLEMPGYPGPGELRKIVRSALNVRGGH